jgi:hypothetical protein
MLLTVILANNEATLEAYVRQAVCASDGFPRSCGSSYLHAVQQMPTGATLAAHLLLLLLLMMMALSDPLARSAGCSAHRTS